MKEMIYKEDPSYEILDQGKYNGRKYYIISYGSHPCAYVENIEGYDGYDEIEEISVHGGVTFNGTKENTHVIGWDYAHCCDYVGYLPNSDGKKWTTSEIKEEVFKVIDQLEELRNKR